MINVLLDSSVFVSSFGNRSKDEAWRIERAICVIKFLKENSESYQICYSERTKNELVNDPNFSCLSQFKLLPSHWLNATWEKIDLTWKNIGSKWDDSSEIELGKQLEEKLPDKAKKDNLNDRGIYGDAVFNSCDVVIHENPRDFNKLRYDSDERHIHLINLIKIDCKAAIEILQKQAAAHNKR